MAKPQAQPNPVQTIVIDNFSGVLTRKPFGLLNSGFAQYLESYGYNPFQLPGQLTWGAEALDVTINHPINGLVLAGKTRVETGEQFLYAITNTGHFIKIDTATDTHDDLHTLTAGSPTFNYGASMEFYNGKVWITNDKGISRIDFDGMNETQVGTWDASHFIQNTYHPLAEFQGKLYVGNTTDGSTTNIGQIDSTNFIVTYSRLSPALPTGLFIRDMDLTPDFSYLSISASEVPQENLIPGNDVVNSFTGTSSIFNWNGSDEGITAGRVLPGFGVTAMNYFGDTSYSFVYDFLGTSLYEGGTKLLTLTELKSPLPNATSATGNFITWMAPSPPVNRLFFYGSLDEQSPKGLFQLYYKEEDTKVVNNSPFLINVTNQYKSVDNLAGTRQIPNKLYFSQQTVQNAGPGTVTNKLFALQIFTIPDADFEELTTNARYQTQCQLFEKKIVVKQIRVYVERTNEDMAFALEINDPDGRGLGEFEYEYTPGDNITKVEGELTRINFNPHQTIPTFGVSLVLRNIGDVNMVFKKVEIDYAPAGK